MKVQEIITPKGPRYIIINKEGVPIQLVVDYVKHIEPFSAPNTIRTYVYCLFLYFQYLESIELDPLDIYSPDDQSRPFRVIGEFISFLLSPEKTMIAVEGHAAKPHSHNSVNQIKNAVIRFYQYLQDAGKFPREVHFTKDAAWYYESTRVAGEIFGPKKGKESYGSLTVQEEMLPFITRKQYTEIFDVVETLRNRIAVALMFESALRVGEVAGLQWEDFCDIQENVLYVTFRDDNENGARVKNASNRIVPMPPYVAELINEYEKTVPADLPHGFVFTSEKRGGWKPLTAKAIYDLVVRAGKKLGYDHGIHPHMFRHGFVEEKLALGADPMDIQNILGHKQLSTTLNVYGHLDYLMKGSKIMELVKNASINHSALTEKYYYRKGDVNNNDSSN